MKSDSSSEYSTISTTGIKAIVERLRTQQFVDSTKAMYYRVWKQFSNFYFRLDAKPGNWVDRLVLFAGFLIDQGKKSKTIKSYISALRAVLKEDNQKFDYDTALLTSLMQACRRKNDFTNTKLPIRKPLLMLLISTIPDLFEAEQPYLTVLYKAIFTTMYFGLLQIGEATQSPHVIKARDVHVGSNKNKIMLVLHTLKMHNKSSKPQIIKISQLT